MNCPLLKFAGNLLPVINSVFGTKFEIRKRIEKQTENILIGNIGIVFNSRVQFVGYASFCAKIKEKLVYYPECQIGCIIICSPDILLFAAPILEHKADEVRQSKMYKSRCNVIIPVDKP